MAAFTFLFIFLHYFSPLIGSTAAVQPPLAPALYVFGDSLLDSGNSNHLPTIAWANYLPYGANFPWGNTGRFTDGKRVTDFVGIDMNLRRITPQKLVIEIGELKAAVFSAISERSKLYTSYGIASGGCGILPETGSQYRLYNTGARKVIMFEIGPIGCIPSITRKYKHDGQYVEDKNLLVSCFNNRLPAMLANLTATLKGSNFVLGHVHWLGYDAAVNPSRYGIADATNPCCKAWFNGTSGCFPLLKPCPNVDKHYFWDGYHLTEVMYSFLAARCIGNKSVCIPHNLKDLLNV